MLSLQKIPIIIFVKSSSKAITINKSDTPAIRFEFFVKKEL